MYRMSLLILLIHQWNAKGLIDGGQEFKQLLKRKAGCVQESLLQSKFDFVLHDCVVDKGKGGGQGCVTSVRQDILYRAPRSRK